MIIDIKTFVQIEHQEEQDSMKRERNLEQIHEEQPF